MLTKNIISPAWGEASECGHPTTPTPANKETVRPEPVGPLDCSAGIKLPPVKAPLYLYGENLESRTNRTLYGVRPAHKEIGWKKFCPLQVWSYR